MIKTFNQYINEGYSTEVEQQPFFISKTDKLYICDYIVKDWMKKPEDIKKILDNPKLKPYFNFHYLQYDLKKIAKFGDRQLDIKWYDKDIIEKSAIKQPTKTSITLRAGMYSVTPYFYKSVKSNEHGDFNYILNGRCGDSDLYGRGFIRSTRLAIIDFIEKVYNINIPYEFFNRLKKGEKFLDLMDELGYTNIRQEHIEKMKEDNFIVEYEDLGLL